MIIFNNETGKGELRALGSDFEAAKKIFEAETSNGLTHGVLFEGLDWRLYSGGENKKEAM